MGLLARIESVVKQVENAKQLDPVLDKVAGAVNTATGPAAVKNAVTGSWLGHPVHPLLVAMPIGAWVGASTLDLIGGKRRRPTADWLVGFGLLSAVPTVVTGAGNWSDLFGADRRVGAVHAVANSTATAAYLASLMARRRGRRGRATLLGLAGLGAVSVGGWLGGHLTYRLAVGVDHTAFDEQAGEWTTVASAADLEDGKPRRVEAGGTALVLVREGGRLYALDATCSHEGGPLDEGELRAGCVVCPWHASEFRLDDGSVARGPASAPQPAYTVRQEGDQIQVRAATA